MEQKIYDLNLKTTYIVLVEIRLVEARHKRVKHLTIEINLCSEGNQILDDLMVTLFHSVHQ